MTDLYYENFVNLLSVNVLSNNDVNFNIKIQSPTFNPYNNTSSRCKNQSLQIENITIDDIEKISSLMDIDESEKFKEITTGTSKNKCIWKYSYSEEFETWILSVYDKSTNKTVMFEYNDTAYMVQCIKSAYSYIIIVKNN